MKRNIDFFIGTITDRVNSLDLGGSPPNLYDPIEYILELGGKRLRPLMALLSHNLFSDDIDPVLDPAIGIEVFHNFTLMHDDIMDEAPLRRGKPTVHEKWDPNIAILSGDVMLVKAYELMMQVDDQKLRPVLDAFNLCAIGVCEGQQIDMDFESQQEVGEAEYLEMIRLKTAVLLGFSMELGAIIGGASNVQIKDLRDFGEYMGIGFQLKDDILDVYGDHVKVGKQVGGDIIANKKTFLWIEALRKADPTTKQELENWEERTEFDAEEKVKAVTGIYDKLSVKKSSDEKMNSYFNNALTILNDLDVPDEKKSLLLSFSQKLIARDH